MKIYLDGARFYGDQISRIGEGFIELGHEITPYISDADLLYSNNPSPTRTQLVKDRNKGKLKPGAKLIFTVLDYPLHLEGFESFQEEIPLIKADLAAADAICSISEYTQRMVKEKYGFDSTVIYNPMKEVWKYFNKAEPQTRYKFLHVGRRHDFNKNFNLAAIAMMMLGKNESDLGLVGNEVSWGSYIGVLNDTHLANQYLAADYVFCLGKIEGISLTVVEAMAAGCIPIIHNELTTKEELLPKELFPEYELVQKTAGSIAEFIWRMESCPDHKNNLVVRLANHFQVNLKEKFDKVNVARRIIDIYSKL